MVKCKGCKDETPDHDTLEGYCMLCAVQRIKWEATFRIENIKFRIENIKLKERITELEALLGYYGEHLPDCAIDKFNPTISKESDCTCGLEQAIKGDDLYLWI